MISSRVAWLLLLVPVVAVSQAGSSSNDDGVVSGERVTQEDLRDATPVASMSLDEFVSRVEKSKQCDRGIVWARFTSSEAKQFSIDDARFDFEGFASELKRRHRKQAFTCLDVIADCVSQKQVVHLTESLSSSGIRNISWNVDKQLYPENTKAPECSK